MSLRNGLIDLNFALGELANSRNRIVRMFGAIAQLFLVEVLYAGSGWKYPSRTMQSVLRWKRLSDLKTLCYRAPDYWDEPTGAAKEWIARAQSELDSGRPSAKG